MGKAKQIRIKNRIYYFYNYYFYQSLKFQIKLRIKQKIDKKHYKNIDIYYIEYIAIKNIDDCGNIYRINLLYLLFNHASGYIEYNSAEEKNGNKYLIFNDSVNENQGLLKKYADVCDEIKNEIKAINGGEENHYGKDYVKIKFNSDNDLSLNKPLKCHAVTIIIRSLFEEGGKIYSQDFLDDTLYEL